MSYPSDQIGDGASVTDERPGQTNKGDLHGFATTPILIAIRARHCGSSCRGFFVLFDDGRGAKAGTQHPSSGHGGCATIVDDNHHIGPNQ